MTHPELKIYGDNIVKHLNNATIVARMSHWNVKGLNFYHYHLLFGKVYETLAADMDGLVETMRAMTYCPEFHCFSGPLMTLEAYSCNYLVNLNIEYMHRLLSSLSLFIEYCEQPDNKSNPLFTGLTNRLQTISDNSMTLLYLLQASQGV
jgi:hypothetical protein